MAADAIIKIEGINSVAGTGSDAISSFDIPEDGEIESMLLNIQTLGMDALDDTAAMEVSFSSVNTFGNSDIRSSIATLRVSQQMLTSGGGGTTQSLFLGGVGIPVSGGERIHLHIGGLSAGVQARGTVYFYLRQRGGVRRPARRRR